MKSVALTTDGAGVSRIESLALPMPVVGPGATGAEVAGAPPGPSARRVQVSRLDPHQVQSGPRRRCLRFVIEGDVRVHAGNGEARLTRGDVVLVDDLDSTGHEVLSSGGARILDVEVDDDWTPSGAVPPPLVRPPTAAVASRIDVEGGEAHFGEFGALAAHGAVQDIEGLTFLCLTDGVASDWHVDASVSLVVVLAGGFELEVSGRGGCRVFYAGDVCLVDDRVGRGHITRSRGETRIAALALPEGHGWTKGDER